MSKCKNRVRVSEVVRVRVRFSYRVRFREMVRLGFV